MHYIISIQIIINENWVFVSKKIKITNYLYCFLLIVVSFDFFFAIILTLFVVHVKIQFYQFANYVKKTVMTVIVFVCYENCQLTLLDNNIIKFSYKVSQ